MIGRGLGLALTLALPNTGAAQEVTLALGRWQVICAPGTERCEAVQSIANSAGDVILRLAFGAAQTDGRREVVLQVPQGTQLAVPVTLADQDGRVFLEAPYFTCLKQHCFARTDASPDALDLMTAHSVVIAGFTDRSGRQINVALPFDGLASALAAVGQ